MRKPGFTLVELLTVIVIIGTLIGLGISGWNAASARSRDNTRKADLARVKSVLHQYYADQRAYPNFDTNSAAPGLTYVADWQLSSNVTCPHSSSAAERLTPRYIATIPADPKQTNNPSGQSCGALTTSLQKGLYLYLAEKKAERFPTGFALLGRLERPSNSEVLLNTDNPILTNTPQFNGYRTANGYAPDGPNYMVTDK